MVLPLTDSRYERPSKQLASKLSVHDLYCKVKLEERTLRGSLLGVFAQSVAFE